MMRTADEYVRSVLACLPPDMAEREQVGMELRSLIAERVAHGESLDAVLAQLGTPAQLAESYLTSMPLEAASLGLRVIAKVIDLGGFAVLIAAASLLLGRAGESLGIFRVVICFVGGFAAFTFYVVLSETRSGQTLGKRMVGIRVVQESGALVTVGQSVVRWLPWLFQFIWIDALFALFTEKKQRAFELLSKTRVVMAAAPQPGR